MKEGWGSFVVPLSGRWLLVACMRALDPMDLDHVRLPDKRYLVILST